MTTLKSAYQALDPARPLEPGLLRGRYVTRVHDPVGALVEELRLADQPLRALLVGQRGVGKSTDLVRMAGKLKKRALRVPGSAAMSGMSARDIFSSIARHVASALEIEWAEDLEEAHDIAWWLGEQIRGSRSSASPILLLDGVERLTSAAASELLLDLLQIEALGFVATCPLEMLYDRSKALVVADFDRRVVLPALRTACFEDDELLRELITRRVGHDVFEYAALDRLVGASGGIYRDLLMLAQQACARASMAHQTQIEHEHAESVVQQRILDLSFGLSSSDLDYLTQVDLDEKLTQDERAVSLILKGAIVVQDEQHTVFRVHPLVQEMVNHHRERRSA